MNNYHISLDPRVSAADFARRSRHARVREAVLFVAGVFTLAFILVVATILLVLLTSRPAAGATGAPHYRRPAVTCRDRLVRVTSRETTYRTVCTWRAR